MAQRVQRLRATGARLLSFGSAGTRRAPRLWLRPIIWLFKGIFYLLYGAAIAVTLVGGVLMMGLALLFIGGALFLIQGFFAVLPDLVKFATTDLPAIAKKLWELVRSVRR